MILDTLAEATRQRVEKQKKEKDFFTLRREAEAIRIGAGQPGAVPTSASYNFITGIDRAETVGYSISY